MSSFGYVQHGHGHLDAAADAARERAAHLWIVAVTHELTDEAAAKVRAGETVLLDSHTLLDMSEVGCWICEAAYAACHGKPCKGDPARYAHGNGQPIYRDGSAGYV